MSSQHCMLLQPGLELSMLQGPADAVQLLNRSDTHSPVSLLQLSPPSQSRSVLHPSDTTSSQVPVLRLHSCPVSQSLLVTHEEPLSTHSPVDKSQVSSPSQSSSFVQSGSSASGAGVGVGAAVGPLGCRSGGEFVNCLPSSYRYCRM